MRKITALSFISLDGVMQSPGGPNEDASGGFKYGGWVAPYSHDLSGEFMQRLLEPSDLLLGRKTFEIWAAYWPSHADNWKGINDVTKYVISTTISDSDWQNSVFLENLSAIKLLKDSKGSDLKVWGSSKLVQSLLENNLVDEFWLLIFPIILGEGKKLFATGATPNAFELVESIVRPGGVVIANYRRTGKIITGTIGE
ncbi:dihydrofolate reductase family protein [Oscillatoria amoena NRMC-F 0135]|nr:dihydrofolate reductase family protein [Oscillatoria amoena NRMC-F 0135]